MSAFDDLEVWADGAEVFVGCSVGEVSEAEGLGDFAWGEEFFELISLASVLVLITQLGAPWLVCPELGRGCGGPR